VKREGEEEVMRYYNRGERWESSRRRGGRGRAEIVVGWERGRGRWMRGVMGRVKSRGGGRGEGVKGGGDRSNG